MGGRSCSAQDKHWFILRTQLLIQIILCPKLNDYLPTNQPRPQRRLPFPSRSFDFNQLTLRSRRRVILETKFNFSVEISQLETADNAE